MKSQPHKQPLARLIGTTVALVLLSAPTLVRGQAAEPFVNHPAYPHIENYLTIDPSAMVFTQHAMNAVQPPTEWIDRDEGEPGYWSGSASSPRSAQHHAVGIHIYSPNYPDGGALGFFDYQPFTHAYLPQDAFDEVLQEGHWTFARKDEVYVALYSWRGTRWQAYEPSELELLDFTQSFDLVADGPPPAAFAGDPTIAPMGPDNVWIVEVGGPNEFGSFAGFRNAILAADVEVTPTPTGFNSNTDFPGARVQRFDVAYDSPGEGPISFGWEGDLVVKDRVVPIADYPRFDNPWIQMERGASSAEMRHGPFRVFHDWPSHTRSVTFEPGP